jgi:hypothetical protein
MNVMVLSDQRMRDQGQCLGIGFGKGRSLCCASGAQPDPGLLLVAWRFP